MDYTQKIDWIQEEKEYDAIEKIKVVKVLGQSNITPEVIKYMRKDEIRMLAELLTDIMRNIEIPQTWN